MKKQFLILIAVLIGLTSFGQQSLGNFPLSPNEGGITEAAHRQRVIDSGGTYYPNIAPHILDVQKSYGRLPDNQMIPSGEGTSVLFSQYPIDGTGDYVVVNSGTKFTTNSENELEEIAANRAAFDYRFGFPILAVNEATENLIEDPLTLGSDYWKVSGATIFGDPSTVSGATLQQANCENTDYTTFTVISNTAFNATSNGTGSHEGGTNNDITWDEGINYLVTFDLVLNSGTLPSVRCKSAPFGAGSILSDTQISIEGSNVLMFVPYTQDPVGSLGFFNTTSVTDYEVTNFSIKIITGFSSPSVDYSTSGYLLTATSPNGTIELDAANTDNSGDYTNSIYLKRATGTGTISIADVTGSYTDISTLTGVAASNGWIRYNITETSGGTEQFGVKLATSGDAIYLFASQQENIIYASSWTFDGSEGSTSSRAADQINNATFVGNSESGNLYAEIAAFADDGTDRYISISDGSVANTVQLYYSTTTNQIVGKMIVGSSVQATLTYTLSDETEFNKCLFSWAEDDFTLVVNGVERATDVSGSVPAFEVLTEISLDDGAGTNDYYGYIKNLAYFKAMSADDRVSQTIQ